MNITVSNAQSVMIDDEVSMRDCAHCCSQNPHSYLLRNLRGAVLVQRGQSAAFLIFLAAIGSLTDLQKPVIVF